MNKTFQKLSISLINAGHVSLSSDWNYQNVVSPFSRLYFIEEGTARIYHHKQSFSLKAGYMYLVPSFAYSHYHCDDFMKQYYASFFEEIGEGLSIYNLKAFRYEVKADTSDKLNFQRLLAINSNRLLVDDNPSVYDNYHTIRQYEQENDRLTAAEYIETQGILLSLFSRFIMEDHPLVSDDSSKAKKVTESVQYILKHLGKNLTVEMLADLAHLNKDYYSRIFKSFLGISPIEYIQNKRIERAQLLLTTTNDTLPEVADKVGINNLSYFSRLFKRTTGKTPGMYRKQLFGYKKG